MKHDLQLQSKPRIVWLDVLRLIAIFMVICIHCSDPFNALADALAVPVSLRIPVTAVIAFAISWAFVATGYKVAPRWAKWIFG